MTQLGENLEVIDGGIAFTVVTVDFAKHACIISREALQSLARMQNGEFGPMEIFLANEAKIRGVARRMIGARVKGSPLHIEANSFR